MRFLNFRVTDVKINAAYNEDNVESLNKRRIVSRRPGLRFEFDLGLEPDSYGEKNLLGVIFAHRNRHGTATPFMTDCPQPLPLDHPLASQASVLATAGATSTAFRVPVATASFDNAVGRFVKFDNHVRVYMIEAVRAVTGNPNQTDIILLPEVTTATIFGTGTSEMINFNSFQMRARYRAESRTEATVVRGWSTHMSVAFEEAIN